MVETDTNVAIESIFPVHYSIAHSVGFRTAVHENPHRLITLWAIVSGQTALIGAAGSTPAPARWLITGE